MGSLLLPPPLTSPPASAFSSPPPPPLLGKLHTNCRAQLCHAQTTPPPPPGAIACARTAPPPPPPDHPNEDLMLAYADTGHFPEAQSVWVQLLHSSSPPGLPAASRLLAAYARLRRFDEILLVARELSSRDPTAAARLYPLAVSCFGGAGELGLMEEAIQEMASRGLRVDSVTGNAFVQYYAASGTVAQMEAAYHRLKKSGILVSKDAIRTMASAYVAQRKYYKLGEFLKDAGLRRRDAGNLLWNLYLLSFAANFKMKSLQAAFLDMVAAGFRPDLTTFNIRAVAFSKMCMFWDLHLTADHMRRDGVAPDLVTHGCFVDAYLERRLARNLSFAFRRLDGDHEPAMATDGVVFEAFGKGGFHASSEALLEATGGKKRWTYYKLLRVYLKKQHRKNQIFWNY